MTTVDEVIARNRRQITRAAIERLSGDVMDRFDHEATVVVTRFPVHEQIVEDLVRIEVRFGARRDVDVHLIFTTDVDGVWVTEVAAPDWTIVSWSVAALDSVDAVRQFVDELLSEHYVTADEA